MQQPPGMEQMLVRCMVQVCEGRALHPKKSLPGHIVCAGVLARCDGQSPGVMGSHMLHEVSTFAVSIILLKAWDQQLSRATYCLPSCAATDKQSRNMAPCGECSEIMSPN